MGNTNSSVQDIKDLKCPQGQYLRYVSGRSGSLVDKIILACTDNTYYDYGEDGGNYWGNDFFHCPQGFNKVEYRLSEHVDAVKFTCSDGRTMDWKGGA